MQMTLIIITGYSVATAPPIYRIVCRLAEVPKTGRTAVAFVALFSMLTSLISWSFSLIISALLAREVTHRVKGADYRAVGAAAYLGIGSVWALGLSSSAALIMAAPGSLPQSIMNISGVIPLSQTLLLWQSMLTAAAIVVLSMFIAYHSAPAESQARSMADMGVTYEPVVIRKEEPEKPGEWLEYSPILSVIVARSASRIVSEVVAKGPSVILELITTCSVPGRRHSASLASAIVREVVAAAVPRSPACSCSTDVCRDGEDDDGVWAGLADGAFLRRRLDAAQLPAARRHLLGSPGLVHPSAGGKWLIKAPYMLRAGKELHHLGWVVRTYARPGRSRTSSTRSGCCRCSALGLKARDIVGYAALQFVVHVPTVLFLVWISITLHWRSRKRSTAKEETKDRRVARFDAGPRRPAFRRRTAEQ
jgi:short-chain fatty acids transporter